MTKETFIEAVDFMRDRYDKQNQIEKLFREEFEDSLFWPYIKYENMLVKVVRDAVNDEEDWIGYYCWERDFGRDTRLGDVTEKDGTPIPFKTAEDLLNLIHNIKN